MIRRLLPFCFLVLAGCAGQTSRKPPLEVFSDMDRQPKYKTQAASAFFADGRASRQPPPGTLAQGQLNEAESRMPPIDRGLVVRGQERFNVYCAPCHDRTGSGQGLVGVKSMWLATNLHDQRIKELPDGELFQVISYGKRSMPAYRFQVPEADRWAIIAYVRALQRATSGTIADVPEDLKGELR